MDRRVRQISGITPYTKGRDYVDILESIINEEGHVYCGEKGNDDLSDHTEDYIYEHLKDKLSPTTCTIVLISAGMKEAIRYDKSQWIPWEIYYSLRETTRNDRTSRRNGIIGVIVPDEIGSYDYVIKKGTCCSTPCNIINRSWMFNILKLNMFNIKVSNTKICTSNSKIYYGECSYISLVKWDDFINNMDHYIQIAENKKDHWEDYNLHISVNA